MHFNVSSWMIGDILEEQVELVRFMKFIESRTMGVVLNISLAIRFVGCWKMVTG